MLNAAVPGRGQFRYLNAGWVVGTALAAYFLAWWFHLRPGVFSFDSGFYLSEAIHGNVSNQKPFLYARFLQATSLGGKYFQLSVFTQASLVVLLLWRAFALALAQRVRPVWLLLCAVLIANPYFATMTFYVQNDLLFSCAVIAILLETLNVARHGTVTTVGLVVIAIAAPMAFGFRANGWLFLPLWLLLLPVALKRREWRPIAITALAATALAYISIVGVDRGDTHELFFPAVIHETVRLAQPGYRYGLGTRLSPETRSAVGIDRLAHGVRVYWPLYWDTVGFMSGGPELKNLPEAQRRALVSSFLRHDLMPNLPSIAAHRLEILTAALLARAEPVDPYDAPVNMPTRLRLWKYRTGAEARNRGVLGRLNHASIESRAWSWNAGVGALVLLAMTFVAAWRRDKAMLVTAALLWVQMAAVFAVAPSAEYRYVLMIYLAPLLLLAATHHSLRASPGSEPSQGPA